MRRGLAGALAVALLAGCHPERRAALRERVEELRRTVRELREEARIVQGVLQDLPPPTAAERHDHDPEGFRPDRRLPPPAEGRPDVIVLSIDTLRADHLGSYGYSRNTSPFFDALAEGGTLYEQAWSPAPWTLPTHVTLLSGQLPVHHGVIEDDLRIPASLPLVQERFGAAGYGTFGAVATLFVSSKYGFERGFDEFQDFGILTKAKNGLATVDADHVFHHALHWAQRQLPGKPLFLFLHVYDVHYNYDPPPPYNERFDRGPAWGDPLYKNYAAYKQDMISAVQLEHQVAQYDEEIAYVDDMFRELVERWRTDRGEPLIVVTADHGEEFGERGSWGHAHTLWPEQLHVPLIVHGPGVVRQRSKVRIGSEDVAPTVAGLAGLSFAAADGEDRSGELRGEATAEADAPGVLATTSRFESMVLRWHDWPYDLYIDVNRRRRALCRLDDDPGCATNVYRQQTERGEAMMAELLAYLGTPWEVRQAGRVKVDGGYIFARGKRQNQILDVAEGDRFTVVPGDAAVTLRREGGSEGPYQPFGGVVPGARCGLGYDGPFTVGSAVSVSLSEKEQLEALGYLQDDEEAVAPGHSGPQDCN